MTPIEKQLMMASAAQNEILASVEQDLGEIYGLLEANLPNLTAKQRAELGLSVKRRLTLASQLKENAKIARERIAQPPPAA